MIEMEWMYDEDIKIKNWNKQRKKFVDYYNQWREEKFWEKWYFEYRNRFDNVHIISKNMWFIDRLLEKNKIDRDELYQEMNWVVYYNHYTQEIIEEYSDSDWLIMLLSIQENPITFILNILK